MRGRCHEPCLRRRNRHPKGMGDDPATNFVEAGKARQDRETGRVGGRPALRPKRVRAEVERRTARCRPSAGRRTCVVELEQPARPLLESQDMSVAPALYGGIGRDRVRPGIALAAVVVEGDRDSSNGAGASEKPARPRINIA